MNLVKLIANSLRQIAVLLLLSKRTIVNLCVRVKEVS
jgi:hypothetical protein